MFMHSNRYYRFMRSQHKTDLPHDFCSHSHTSAHHKDGAE